MSISNDIIKEIENKSEYYNGVIELYKLHELDVDLRKYYIISDRIKKVLGQTLKIDKRLLIDNILKSKDDYIDFAGKYSNEKYTFRVKDYNIWISSIFIKELISVKDILPDELFEL